MKRLLTIFSVFLVVMAMAGVAGASLVNGGFETGNLTGWDSTGNAVVVTSEKTYEDLTAIPPISGTTYPPAKGAYFAVVTAGIAGSFYNVSQSVAMAKGDWLSGRALFDGRDYLEPGYWPWYNDYAAVRIFNSAGVQVEEPWYRDISQVGNLGHTGWEFWSWTAPGAGTYTLSLGAANIGDACSWWSSRAYFDANAHAVPIPGALLLLGSGLVGLLGYRRLKG